MSYKPYFTKSALLYYDATNSLAQSAEKEHHNRVIYGQLCGNSHHNSTKDITNDVRRHEHGVSYTACACTWQ